MTKSNVFILWELSIAILLQLRRNVSLCLVLILVLCTLGSVAVFAEDAPVITGGYMGGIPGVGQYLHVVVDGTYQENSFENALTSAGAYAVTADYSWEYGEGDSWTVVTPVDAAKRLCKVTADMVGKYVRCTVTPKAGDVTGASYTVQFPGKMKTAADLNLQTTVQKKITFDSAVAAPGQAFAIRVFGETIKSGESYTAQPYVGDESGEQKDISFE